jgi:hypothetical protein
LDPMVGTSDQWEVVDPVSGDGFQWYLYRRGARQAWESRLRQECCHPRDFMA